MKKTVLFLINGFGIEKKDSYSIYDENLLPTLDKMMKNNLYTSVESKASDYQSGYQLFSTGSISTSNYAYLNDLIENNKLFDFPNLKKFSDENIGKESKIHIFLNFNNNEIIEDLNKFVKSLKIDINRIIIHIILNQKSLTEYKSIITLISNFTYSNFRANNIGLIFGENCLIDEDKIESLKTVERVLYNSKSGETWLEYTKKLNNLANNNVLPINVYPFCVNDNFTLQNEDTIVFFNFDKGPYQKLIDGILNPQIVYKTVDSSTLHFYSLFPLEDNRVLNLLDNVKAEDYMVKYLDSANLNALILTDKDNLNIINYMVNGLDNTASPRVKYSLTSKELLENKEQLNALLAKADYDLIIINTRIDNLKTINEVKASLHEFDNYVANLESVCEGKATLIVSSLFGINKEFQISNLANDKATVNFYGSVPLIVIDKDYSKEEYSLGYGTLVNILGTAIKCCNPEVKYPTMLKKKSTLLKMFQDKLGKK